MSEPTSKSERVRTAMVIAARWDHLSTVISTVAGKMRDRDEKKTGSFRCDLFVVIVDHKHATRDEIKARVEQLTGEQWESVKQIISPTQFADFTDLSRRKQQHRLAEYMALELIPKVIRKTKEVNIGLVWEPEWTPWIVAGSAVSAALPDVSWWDPPGMPDLRLLPDIRTSRALREPASIGGTVLLGESDGIDEVKERLRLFAPLAFPVLLIGETGTGKELCASILHEESGRKGSLASINGAMLDPALASSDLFGHIKGSFTGAHRDRDGRIREAKEGTFFLDEISSVPLVTQSKLLRALQYAEDGRVLIEPVGAQGGETIPARFVSALQRDPLAHGDLREDLYYRIAGLTLTLPPLRERGDDVMILARAFLKKMRDTQGEGPTRFSRDIELIFREHLWPGNVRELAQVIRMAWVLAMGRGAGGIAAKDLPGYLVSSNEPVPTGSSLKERVAMLVKREAEAAFEKHPNNKTEAARSLGFERGQELERYVESQTKILTEESQ